jgi:RsiW-degrading membrane proteinase PrsW (M82 family)
MILSFFDDIKSLWPILIMFLLPMLFGLWSTYLLIRFAVVFHQSARIARQNWRAADAAVE